MTEHFDRIATMRLWSGRPRIEPLAGGLSNTSYAVTDSHGKYVVRLTRDFPFHGVSRQREIEVSRASHAAGFAPELIYAEPGLTVTRFVEGRVLTAADMREGVERVAALAMNFCHVMSRQQHISAPLFDPFAINRDYLRQLDELGAPGDPHWRSVNDAMETVQPVQDASFGHHDLLPANLIDDGERLWLIDYEYAGFGAPLFDLANLSSNSGFGPAESAELLSHYFGTAPDAAMQQAHAAMEVTSLLRETLWSLVSAHHLDAPGADYAAYAGSSRRRFDAALESYRERFA